MATANAINIPNLTQDALDRTPPFLNFMSPLHATFEIRKLPGVNFTVQSVNIPGMSLSPVYQANPLVKIPKMGDHIDYEPLEITFKIDEELDNYLQLHNWIRGLGFPENYNEFAVQNNQSKISGLGSYSDASLMIRNSERNINFEIVYQDAHPISLSSVFFDTRNMDVDYVSATATFVYSHFNINRV